MNLHPLKPHEIEIEKLGQDVGFLRGQIKEAQSIAAAAAAAGFLLPSAPLADQDGLIPSLSCFLVSRLSSQNSKPNTSLPFSFVTSRSQQSIESCLDKLDFLIDAVIRDDANRQSQAKSLSRVLRRTYMMLSFQSTLFSSFIAAFDSFHPVPIDTNTTDLRSAAPKFWMAFLASIFTLSTNNWPHNINSWFVLVSWLRILLGCISTPKEEELSNSGSSFAHSRSKSEYLSSPQPNLLSQCSSPYLNKITSCRSAEPPPAPTANTSLEWLRRITIWESSTHYKVFFNTRFIPFIEKNYSFLLNSIPSGNSNRPPCTLSAQFISNLNDASSKIINSLPRFDFDPTHIWEQSNRILEESRIAQRRNSLNFPNSSNVPRSTLASSGPKFASPPSIDTDTSSSTLNYSNGYTSLNASAFSSQKEYSILDSFSSLATPTSHPQHSLFVSCAQQQMEDSLTSLMWLESVYHTEAQNAYRVLKIPSPLGPEESTHANNEGDLSNHNDSTFNSHSGSSEPALTLTPGLGVDLKRMLDDWALKSGLSDIDSDGSTVFSVEVLFFVVLLRTLQLEARKIPDYSALVKNLRFMGALYAICFEVVLNVYEMSDCPNLKFPRILNVVQIEPFDLSKALSGLGHIVSATCKPLRKHLCVIEEVLLEELVWNSRSDIFQAYNPATKSMFAYFLDSAGHPAQPIKTVRTAVTDEKLFDNYIQLLRQKSINQHLDSLSINHASYNLFVKLLRSGCGRIRQLCADLSASRYQCSESGSQHSQFTEGMVRQVEFMVAIICTQLTEKVLKDRHLDTIILCSVYAISSINWPIGTIDYISFEDMVQQYAKQFQAKSSVFTKIASSRPSAKSNDSNTLIVDSPGITKSSTNVGRPKRAPSSRLANKSKSKKQDSSPLALSPDSFSPPSPTRHNVALVEYYNSSFLEDCADILQLFIPAKMGMENDSSYSFLPKAPLSDANALLIASQSLTAHSSADASSIWKKKLNIATPVAMKACFTGEVTRKTSIGLSQSNHGIMGNRRISMEYNREGLTGSPVIRRLDFSENGLESPTSNRSTVPYLESSRSSPTIVWANIPTATKYASIVLESSEADQIQMDVGINEKLKKRKADSELVQPNDEENKYKKVKYD